MRRLASSLAALLLAACSRTEVLPLGGEPAVTYTFDVDVAVEIYDQRQRREAPGLIRSIELALDSQLGPAPDAESSRRRVLEAHKFFLGDNLRGELGFLPSPQDAEEGRFAYESKNTSLIPAGGRWERTGPGRVTLYEDDGTERLELYEHGDDYVVNSDTIPYRFVAN